MQVGASKAFNCRVPPVLVVGPWYWNDELLPLAKIQGIVAEFVSKEK